MWETDEARDFYVDSGGNYFDDIVGLGDDFELIEAGMSYGSNKSKKTNRSTSDNDTVNKTGTSNASSTSNDRYVSSNYYRYLYDNSDSDSGSN